MAVEALKCTVTEKLEKLTELLTREPAVSGKAVVKELKGFSLVKMKAAKELKRMKVVKELERMKEALEEISGYFVDAESKWSDSEVKAWFQECLKHLYGAEDAVDTLSVRCKTSKLTFRLAFLKNRRLCRKIAEIRRQVLVLEKPLGLEKRRQPDDMEDPNFRSACSTSPEVNTIKVKSATSFKRDRNNGSKLVYNYSFHEGQLNKRLKIIDELVEYSSPRHSPGVFSRKLSLKLVHQLLEDSTRPSPEVFAIHGEKGSGKTTLAKAVYINKQVMERFKSCSAWITPSIGATTEHLLVMLLREIRSPDDFSGGDHGDIPSLERMVSEILKDKQYLIVLDDVVSWEMWEGLRSAFPEQHGGRRSKILLITCDQEVAKRADRQCQVEKLDDEDSWDLFLNQAGVESGLEDKEHEIVQACNGLPLNAMLLGSLVYKKEYEEWPKLPSETSDLISLCYDVLPAHLKLCLIYMVLFPKEFDIPVRRLQRLWLAEGFVNLGDDVEEYFNYLVDRSLIQVSKLASDDSPKRCTLLGSLHDHLIPKAEVISLFHVHNRYSSVSCDVADPVCVRRLVEATDIRNCTLNPDKLGSLRSFISFNIQKKDTPATEVGKLLTSVLGHGKRLLRVLDLEGVYKPSLPDNLGDFFHLRYLGLRWTFLDTLPESIGNLYYLETLDIKHTNITTLPPFIWKMKHLKHLNAEGIHLDLPRNPRGSWPPLMTLTGFSVDDTSFKKGSSLKELNKIRELEITFQLSNSDQLLHWISSLTAIQALRLRSKDHIGRPSSITLKSLSELKHLTHLNLLGKLQRLPDIDDFPPKLRVLTLAISELTEDPMPILGQLPNLTALRLLANSYKGNKIICPAGGFEELRVLKLWMLKNLEDWEVEEGAMGKLKELNIRCCDKLKSIPGKVLAEIKELTLTNMSQEFRRQVQVQTAVSPIINEYDFTPLPWEM